MNVVILTEGGKNKGFGHIARCSSIYDSFKDYGITPLFVINGDESVNGFIEDYMPYDWINDSLDFLNSDDIVIIDSYLTNQQFYDELVSKVSLCVYLDDNNRLEYPKGILLNGTILASEMGYNSVLGRDDLLGSEYILLRKSFEEDIEFKVSKDIKTVLITMGGNDFRNLTPEILKLLDSNLNKKVVIGNSFKNIEEIKQIADSNTELLFNLSADEMLQTMLESDLAISSSGQTLYELARVGIPTIAIGVVDNQINNIKNWQKQGFIEFAGFYNDNNLLNNIKSKIGLLQSFDSRSIKNELGKKAVDGKGSKRLVKKILSSYYKNNSILRKVSKQDCLKIYEISNDKEVRKASFNSEEIPLENHKKWFNNVIKDKDVTFLVLEYDGDIIGQVRFVDNTVSISLNKKYRGLGLSTFMLNKACDFVNFDNLIAFIKKDNKASTSLFEHCGFKLVAEDENAYKYIRSK